MLLARTLSSLCPKASSQVVTAAFSTSAPVATEATKPKTKLNIPTKRAAKLLLDLNNEEVNEYAGKYPDFKAGDAIEVRIMQSRTTKSIQTMKGIVIGRRNRGLSSSFILRNHVGETGYESTMPLYNPLIQSIEVLQKNAIHKGKKRVRRSKLYYLRDLPAKRTTVN